MGIQDGNDFDSCLFAAIDRQIIALKSKILQAGPFLLLIDDQTSYPYTSSNHYSGTPFEPYEVRHLQYLTMMNYENRGVALPCSDWHDEIESCSPAAIALQIQGPPTTNKSTRPPSKKISIADYKKLRKDGPSKQVSDSCEVRSRASSIGSTEPLSCGPSSEITQESKTAVDRAGILRSQLANQKIEAKRIALQNLNTSFTHNLISNRNTPTPAISITDPHVTKPKLRSPLRPVIKHPLPPRPQSPKRGRDVKLPYNNLRQQKRPIENTSSPPHKQAQKRLKNNIANVPSVSKDLNFQKSGNSNPSRISSNPSLESAQLSPSTQRDPNYNQKRTKPRKRTPIKIPDRLSPLPDDLDDFDLEHSDNLGDLGDLDDCDELSSQISSAKSNSSENYVNVKSRSSSPPFVFPRLLSPDLPLIVEQQLSRLQKKNINLNSVEARHEEVRQPGTPGVARRNTKVGHPPKRSSDIIEVNVKSKNKYGIPTTRTSEEVKSFVVKIKYKKRRAKDIERILRMTPKLELEAQRLANLKDKKDENTNSGVPLKITSSDTASKISKNISTKKRISEISEALSSPAKGIKTYKDDTVRPNSSHDTLKSPALLKNNHLSTPKKNDIKGIKMCKIPSTDSNNTHSPNVSTPVPAGKRSNKNNSSTSNPVHQCDVSRFVSEALTLKRKMDSELKTKDIDARKYLSDIETRAGLCTGIECLLAYYSAFSVKKDKRPSDRANNWESTIGLLEFVFRTSEPFLLLHTLAAQLFALVKEELNRNYLEHVSIMKEASSELLEKIVRNAQSRDRYWMLASKGQDVLQKMGFANSVGPWTCWHDGREYFLKVLAEYEHAEKLGWKASFQ
ncbi:hypothetical protein OnM2_027017 [Erysiphe neolycopersici]|uniref:Uncharacterized protein n=1 Tax=Erysiphe neolycopersici TaxID=212602 RepID=A0A420I0B6_9PEZI|nr:hypothetical protein OnM2_027017 [Erysiphe neolycopersici]